jgi:outer membrane lipoprotein-sorting protein
MVRSRRSTRALTVAVVVLTVLAGCAGGLAGGSSDGKVSEDLADRYESVQSYEATVETHYQSPRRNVTFERDVVAKPHNRTMAVEFRRPAALRGFRRVETDGSGWRSADKPAAVTQVNVPGPRYRDLIEVHLDNYEHATNGTTTVEGQQAKILDLIPGENSTKYNWIRVWVDTDRSVPLQTKVWFFGNTTVTTTYHNLTLNTGVSDEAFEIEAAGPGGVTAGGPGSGSDQPASSGDGPSRGAGPSEDAAGPGG